MPRTCFSTTRPTAAAAVGRTALDRAYARADYEVLSDTFVDEYAARCVQLRHVKSGAQVLSMEKADKNKVFGISFRTPVDDSTGVPHILEHSVLCGSRKYPIKEPFVELLKGSLHTFLNAFTYPDRTCYPVSSQNLKDFYNLADVYLDAVFHPLAVRDPMILKQEGWHYDLKSTSDPLQINGVVYNEMKGVYSSPEALHDRLLTSRLFADNTYFHDSGGDPDAIPDLTFDQFKGFHERHYHPSNAMVFFYGDDPVGPRLDLLSSYLDEFEARPEHKRQSEVARQQLWQELPAAVRNEFPALEGQDTGHFASLGWLLHYDAMQPRDHLEWSVLGEMLLGNSSALLSKPLNESGLGHYVMGGLQTELIQSYFSVGLAGLEDGDSAPEELRSLILDNLRALAEEGIPDTAIGAAINRIEFALREFDTGSSHRGLSFMIAALGRWNYGLDPVDAFQFEAPLAALKADLAARKPVFEDLIRRTLLDNRHAILAVTSPREGLEIETQERITKELDSKKQDMDEKDIGQYVADAAALRERQAEDDPPEARALVPRLTLADLDREHNETPTRTREVAAASGTTLLEHPMATNGVLYTRVNVDVTGIPDELVEYFPLLLRALSGETGAGGRDAVSLSREMDTHTGGLGASASVVPQLARVPDSTLSAVPPEDSARLFLTMSGKALGSSAGHMFGLMEALLFEPELNSDAARSRIGEMLRESVAEADISIVESGHRFASSAIGARLGLAGYLQDTMSGIGAVRASRAHLEAFEAGNWDRELLGKLEMLLAHVHLRARNPSNVHVGITGDEATLAATADDVANFVVGLPGAAGAAAVSTSVAAEAAGQGATAASWAGWRPESTGPAQEGLVVPTQVNYVGMGARAFAPGERVPGSTAVALNYLRTGPLWNSVRVMGGAYGAMCNVNANGVATFLSYRDPNVKRTLDCYRSAAEALVGEAPEGEQLERAIIGAIGGLDAPRTPSQRGSTAMAAHLAGESPEERQRWRDEVLGTSVRDIRQVGERLVEALRDDPNVVVVGSDAALGGAVGEGVQLETSRFV